jgi:Ser/Thr protein kinase RdoA (MazF antagonist)
VTGPRPSTAPDAREAAAAFGLGEVSGPVVLSARGELGRIWRLLTTSGTWALKEVFDPGPTGAADALRDAAFQERALAGGIPMPLPVAARDGQVLVTVGPVGDRRAVRVYSWVELRGRDAVPPLADVAAILGRLHALAPAEDRPVHPWFRDPPDPSTWPELLDRARAAGAPWLATLERLVPILLETTAAAGRPSGDPARLVTCHLDYNPENVLVDRAGDVCVVDWENSGPGELEQELASVVAEFVRDATATEAFLAAYRDAGGPAVLVDRRSFAMTFVVQANLIATYVRRALDAPDPEDARRAAFWVEDIAANAFTIERADSWLDAARAAGLAG